ncbi:MAG: enoyl-CoA hydratase-related protein [Pseudomonadota bacterium]|uniref:enoyl-CoA hydratase/isomerase family protein n=1 Tax=Caldimonas aquatica TaxID=376175 RepID=UPI003482833A
MSVPPDMAGQPPQGAAAGEPLIVQRHEGWVHVRFNRPEALNALDVATARAFLGVVESLANDDGVRAVLLSGAGRAFMAGGDLAQLRAAPVETAHALIGPLHQALRRLTSMRAPVVAALHGAVAGAGLSLALAADVAIAAAGTRFNLAYTRIGTSCDLGATWSLPRMVGLRRALQIALLSEDFDADRAEAWGLVARVVPAERLVEEAQALTRRLAQGPTRAYGHIKRLMRTSSGQPLDRQLDDEQSAFADCAAGEDFAEGLDAFFDKRAPRFVGR